MEKLIISNLEIEDYTKNVYKNCKNDVIGTNNPIEGERSFILCNIQRTIGLLDQTDINDSAVLEVISILLRTSVNISEYQRYLYFYKAEVGIGNVNDSSDLTAAERQVIKELCLSVRAEYLAKSDYSSCCYSAIKAFMITALCVLKKGMGTNVHRIDICVDIYDEVTQIVLEISDTVADHIFINWNSTNQINDLYMLYKTQYKGFDNDTILDLVSADVIEKQFYLADERFTIAPSILMKQYLAIIEKEVNEILVLAGKNPSGAHKNWYDMKNIVRKQAIGKDFDGFELHEVLDDLYVSRNHTMHGEEFISKEEYEVLREYKAKGLFEMLSAYKLVLKGTVIHPTIDEIKTMLESS